MALDQPLLTRRRIFASALETTNGTAATLNASAAVFNVYDLALAGEVAYIERPKQGGFGNTTGVVAGRKGTSTYWTNPTGTGSGSGDHADLLLGCGFTASGDTYTANSQAQQSLTQGGFYDGRLFKLVGCMGNSIWTLRSGEPIRADWTFNGVWAVPTGVALPSPTYPTTHPPNVVSSTITFGGTAYMWDELKLDFGNSVIHREDGGAGAAGYKTAWITNRLAKLTVPPEALALATKDWYADYLAGTEIAFSCVVGTVGNRITITASHLQQNKLPDIGDRNGLMVDGLSFDLNQDNLVIAFD